MRRFPRRSVTGLRRPNAEEHQLVCKTAVRSLRVCCTILIALSASCVGLCGVLLTLLFSGHRANLALYLIPCAALLLLVALMIVRIMGWKADLEQLVSRRYYLADAVCSGIDKSRAGKRYTPVRIDCVSGGGAVVGYPLDNRSLRSRAWQPGFPVLILLVSHWRGGLISSWEKGGVWNP